MNKAEIFHMELFRSLHCPWMPPFPYKADEAAIVYAKDRTAEMMGDFEAVIDKLDEYKRGGDWGEGWHKALDELRNYVVRIKRLAEVAP